MLVQVKKWGNSASVRIPAALMTSASIKLDQTVDIRVESGRLVIEPVLACVYNLDAMVAQMVPETFHDDSDFGAPIGGEIW